MPETKIQGLDHLSRFHNQHGVELGFTPQTWTPEANSLPPRDSQSEFSAAAASPGKLSEI